MLHQALGYIPCDPILTLKALLLEVGSTTQLENLQNMGLENKKYFKQLASRYYFRDALCLEKLLFIPWSNNQERFTESMNLSYLFVNR